MGKSLPLHIQNLNKFPPHTLHPYKFADSILCMHRNLLILLSFFFLASCSSPSEKENTTPKPTAINPTLELGKGLFYGKCASCHMVNKDMTGPALKGVEDRWPDKQKMYAFIRNSSEVIKTDKYAKDLWLKYNQTMMLPHPDLKDEDIRAILDYINSVTE